MSWDPQGGSAAHRRDFTALYDAAKRQGLDPIAAWKKAADVMERRGNQLRTDGGEDRAVKPVGVEAAVRRFLRETLRAALPKTSAGFSTADVRAWLRRNSLHHIGEATFTRIMRKLNTDFGCELRGARPVHIELVSKPKGLYRVHKA